MSHHDLAAALLEARTTFTNSADLEAALAAAAEEAHRARQGDGAAGSPEHVLYAALHAEEVAAAALHELAQQERDLAAVSGQQQAARPDAIAS